MAIFVRMAVRPTPPQVRSINQSTNQPIFYSPLCLLWVDLLAYKLNDGVILVVMGMQMCRTVALVAQYAAPIMCRKCARQECARDFVRACGSIATTISNSMDVSMMDEVIQVRLSVSVRYAELRKDG